MIREQIFMHVKMFHAQKNTFYTSTLPSTFLGHPRFFHLHQIFFLRPLLFSTGYTVTLYCPPNNNRIPLGIFEEAIFDSFSNFFFKLKIFSIVALTFDQDDDREPFISFLNDSMGSVGSNRSKIAFAQRECKECLVATVARVSKCVNNGEGAENEEKSENDNEDRKIEVCSICGYCIKMHIYVN